MRYSGMAFKWNIIIAAGTFGSIKLDKWLNTKPLFTLLVPALHRYCYVLVFRDFFPLKIKNKFYAENHF